MMASQIVKVERDKLASCMACPLCNKLFRDATAISECLHTCQCFSVSQSLSVSHAHVPPISDFFFLSDFTWSINCSFHLGSLWFTFYS